MRCISCDEALTEFESTRRYAETNEFVDLCSKCFNEVDGDFLTIERADLKHGNDEGYTYYGVEELNFDNLKFTNDFSEDND
jgi:hypothetical protein